MAIEDAGSHNSMAIGANAAIFFICFSFEVVDQRVRAEKHLSMSLTRSLIFSDGMGEGILLRLKVVCRFSKVMGS